MSFCYFTWFFDHIRNLPFRLQHQIALLVVMVPPSAVFTQLTAAGIRSFSSVGTVVYVAHHVGVTAVGEPPRKVVLAVYGGVSMSQSAVNSLL